MIKDGNFIHIEAFMVTELGLKGNDLLVYAIIYGFSQDGKSRFTGSLDYLAEWTNSTVQGCLKNLNSLIEKGLISKSKKGNSCEYWVKSESEIKQSLIENDQSGLNKVESGLNKVESGLNKVESEVKQSLNNTIINNSLNNTHTIGACADSFSENQKTENPQKTGNDFEDYNWGDLQRELYALVVDHNRYGNHKKLLLDSKSEIDFIQRECRSLVEKWRNENPLDIREAFFNFLDVLCMDEKTWWKGNSFNAFVNNYRRFTREFYNESDFLEKKRGNER